jgi:hypothetical protein
MMPPVRDRTRGQRSPADRIDGKRSLRAEEEAAIDVKPAMSQAVGGAYMTLTLNE